MAPDFRFIADTAQADADIFPPQRPGNALPDAGFAGARSAYEQQDGTGLLPV